VCLEKPKIAPHIPNMIATIANTLGIDKEEISIKATTTEEMGFAGREEGLMAYASVLICKL
jgi:2-C-methyl-D-erythritol 2,4-cyclodiphosphate synthase